MIRYLVLLAVAGIITMILGSAVTPTLTTLGFWYALSASVALTLIATYLVAATNRVLLALVASLAAATFSAAFVQLAWPGWTEMFAAREQYTPVVWFEVAFWIGGVVGALMSGQRLFAGLTGNRAATRAHRASTAHVRSGMPSRMHSLLRGVLVFLGAIALAVLLRQVSMIGNDMFMIIINLAGIVGVVATMVWMFKSAFGKNGHAH